MTRKLTRMRIALFSIACCLAGSRLWAQSATDQDLEGLLPPAGAELSPQSREILQALTGNRLGVAEERANKLLRDAPSGWEGLYWLGLLEVRRGDLYPAVRRLTRAREFHPAACISKVLGIAYYMLRQHRLFQQMMEEAVQAAPQDFGPYYYLGRFYEADLNDFVRAGEQFQKAIERNADHFRSHYHLGFTFEARREPERAEAEYRRALDLAGRAGHVTFDEPLLGLARLRSQSNLNSEAVAYAQKAVALNPRDAAARKLFGKILSALDRHAEAARQWEAAAALDPTDSGAMYRLYQEYRRMGDSPRAAAALAGYRKIASVYGFN